MSNTVSKLSTGPGVFDLSEKASFGSHFNETSFLLHHRLPETGLFDLGRIAGLADSMLSSGRKDIFSELNFKGAELNSKFTSLPPATQLANAVKRLPESGSWIKLSRAQEFDKDYAELLDSMIQELEQLSGRPIRSDLTWATMTLFLASPGISTPYHIDHESNFLFQVAGEKDVCLFDQNDRELLPDREIERFYNGNAEAAHYREEHQNRGTVFHLTPGLAVHHPPLAPHWVKNGDSVSVSVSVGLCLRPLEQRARVYQANFLLRQLGLSPQRPGVSRSADLVKTRMMGMFEKRNPKTYRDVVFAPMDRLKAPLRMVRP